MALLLLARTLGCKLYALTVDHGLRSESASEAKQVASWCKNLGIEHHTLKWQHDEIQSGIQEKARDARYKLMSKWCREHGVAHLLTGHHQDDQIETFLLRLLRGSGLEGLACMLPVSKRHDITLHRPLLGKTKAELLSILKSYGQDYFDDPTNHKPDYTRNRIRRMANDLTDEERARIIKLIDSCHDFRKSLENKLSESLNYCSSLNDLGYATLDLSRYKTLPPELRVRLLQTLCHTISGNGEPLRSEKISRLDAAFCSPSPTSKYTLHGVTFMAQKNHWLVLREKSKIAPAIAITQKPFLWDNRFLIHMPDAKPGMSVRMLGSAPKPMRKILERSGIPKAVWPTLPALFALEECMTIPHIHTTTANIRYIPAKPLEAGWFFAHNERNIFVKESHRA